MQKDAFCNLSAVEIQKDSIVLSRGNRRIIQRGMLDQPDFQLCAVTLRVPVEGHQNIQDVVGILFGPTTRPSQNCSRKGGASGMVGDKTSPIRPGRESVLVSFGYATREDCRHCSR